MSVRAKLEREMRRKEADIARLEAELSQAKLLLQGFQDALKFIPRDSATNGPNSNTFRPGTALHKAYEFIKNKGRPVRLEELLGGIGKNPEDKNARLSLAGSLGHWVRKGEIFTRPSQNTFGLVGLDNSPSAANSEPEPITTQSDDDDIPF